MRPTPEDLKDESRFALLEEVAHADLVTAVQAHLRRRSPVRTLYIALNAGLGALVGAGTVLTDEPLRALSGLAIGAFLGFLVLLPVHEAVHALAYRWFGARDTRVIYRWRNLTAYCVADRFVARGGEFAAVCLAPFVAINAVLLAAIAAWDPFQPILWGMLVFHVAACSGDFAFANLTWLHRHDGLLTYDDVPAARTLFYRTCPAVGLSPA